MRKKDKSTKRSTIKVFTLTVYYQVYVALTTVIRVHVITPTITFLTVIIVTVGI